MFCIVYNADSIQRKKYNGDIKELEWLDINIPTMTNKQCKIQNFVLQAH